MTTLPITDLIDRAVAWEPHGDQFTAVLRSANYGVQKQTVARATFDTVDTRLYPALRAMLTHRRKRASQLSLHIDLRGDWLRCSRHHWNTPQVLCDRFGCAFHVFEFDKLRLSATTPCLVYVDVHSYLVAETGTALSYAYDFYGTTVEFDVVGMERAFPGWEHRLALVQSLGLTEKEVVEMVCTTLPTGMPQVLPATVLE